MLYCKENNEDILHSPLNLLYTAWSDQQLTVNQTVTENYTQPERLLVALSERERQAFFEGLRTGARLILELHGR